MRRSRSVLVSTITVFLVMAMVAVGMCGPPVGAGEGSRAAAPGPGLNNPGGAPAGATGSQGAGAQGSGLTATPGGGYGGAGGSGAGSPGLVLSAIRGSKYDITNAQRASYYIPFCQMNSGLRIVGDWYSKKFSESGRYAGPQADTRDFRYGDNLNVDWTAALWSLQAQIDYQPLSCAKSLKVGPSIGVQKYVSNFKVTDNTNPALSDVNARKSTPTFGTVGAWIELGLPGVLSAVAGGSSCGSSCDEACPPMSRLYLSATGGFAKDWTSWSYEALLSLFTVKKGSMWSDSKYGKYLPTLRTDIGYMATYLTESHHDFTSTEYLSPAAVALGANYRTLNENSKVNFGTYILRANLAV